jgi:hypothetical protein
VRMFTSDVIGHYFSMMYVIVYFTSRVPSVQFLLVKLLKK